MTAFAWKTTKRPDSRHSPTRAAHRSVRRLQEPEDLALHEDLDAERDGTVLHRAQHLEPGAVADVRETCVAVAAEVALQDPPVGRAVEQRSPLFELEDAIRRLHRMELGHAPVVQHLAAAHRVAEMDLPVVLRPDVAECRGDAAFGHHGVRLAEERLADDAGRARRATPTRSRRASPRRRRR